MAQSNNRQSDPILMDLPSELVTERLLLRVPRAGDGARLNAAVVESAAELAPWMPWAEPTPKVEQTEQWARQTAARFLSREQIHFSLYLKGPNESDTCIGGCGLNKLDWHVPMGEFGYWLRTSHVGRGLMSEAVAELVRFAFDVLKLRRLQLRCDVKNPRSAAVAQRAGFTLEGVLRNEARDHRGELRDTCLYARVV
jgi:RimJ/RimL family protein N-acetyltransferase